MTVKNPKKGFRIRKLVIFKMEHSHPDDTLFRSFISTHEFSIPIF